MRKRCIQIFGVVRFVIFKILSLNQLITKGLYVIEKESRLITKNKGTIQLGRRVHLFTHTRIQSEGSLIIGDYLSLNSYSRIIALEKIVIGDHVTIAQFVTILDHDHAYNFKNNTMTLKGYKTLPISIGSNVWIGDKVTILKGVTIGNNVIIGANSLVNKSIPNNCIAAGNPAKIIKKLN